MLIAEFLSQLHKDWKLIVAGMAVWLAIGGIFLFFCPAQWEAIGYVRVGQITNSNIESISAAMTRASSPPTIKLILQNMKLADNEEDIKKLQSRLQLRKIDDRTFLIKVRANDRVLAQKSTQNIVDELVRQHKIIIKPIIQNFEEDIKQTANEQPEIKKWLSNNLGFSGKLQDGELTLRRIISLQMLLRPPATEPTSLMIPIYVSDKPVFPKTSMVLAISVLLGLVTGFIFVFGRCEI